MNPTFTNTNSIHQNVLNIVLLQEITIFQEVSQSEKPKLLVVLLCLIIDTEFYAKHAILNNSGKTRLWQKLHNDFCNHPDVVCYAASPLNAGFTSRVVDEVVAEAVISICQDNDVTYKNTQLTTSSFVLEGRSEISQWSYSTPNPVPSPKQGMELVLISRTRRTMPSELQQAFLENSRSQTDIMASMHKLLTIRYQRLEELYEDTLQQYRLDVIASHEARHLDWESRELIATREYNRRVIADEREEESRRSLLEILSRCKRSRSPLSSLTRINELN
ncbi:hypothetical protein J3Q64DRAFT_1694006 [Phycomyces blakesleeanus]|uniref:Uncharacterized protein n=2 Tax=Phycomyces blakesleeanus TaxID=4837 RepID=A0A167QAK8_PHYB8|nr:hypothetical protein PHYBLDRAFT_58427 [Phycomyces blakesleeanus NRRL 1555(-)]OAD79376.1 hypothetical protein PHYBLDRAFT_58427 [Phycomyces blakesleeanus NRRL 1555(-)]|eukprot:XP_018297416.1 hypothetical protein PHYBLDRAFT_58427 [Phycomyces blakesleeanus NRRL 1555(-)]